MKNIELSKFKVKSTKEAHKKVDEWLDFLNKNMESVLLTLVDEKMAVENIFKEKTEDGEIYLYWYSIQGNPVVEVENSNHEVDKKHLEYWNLCIDNKFKQIDLSPKVTMIQENVLKEINKIIKKKWI